MTQVETYADGASTSDAELITAVRGGDHSAFGALYERHAAAARTVARQYVHSSSDADDVVSEAFAKVLGILQTGGGPDVTFRAYLFTVVRRLSYDLVNGVRRTQPTDDVETFETAFGPMASTEDPTLQGFERSIVTKAYRGLPERWQAVLWYTEVEEMNPAQIAPLLGLSANGVSALAYRAREGLRQAYLQQHLTGAASEGCEVVNPLLGSYVRGGLAKRENAKVDAHLEGCGECRGLVLELGDVSHGMRAVIAPLVFGVAGLGLVGHALPVVGGGAVAGGAGGAGAGTGASASASGTTAGTSGGAAAGGSGAVGAGGGAAATAGAAGGTTAAGAGAGGAVAAAASATGAVAAGSGAAVAGATGIAAFIAASPLIAAAVGVVAIAAVGAGVVALNGGFSPDTPPSAGASPDPSSSPTDTPSGSPTTAPTPPSADPTSPANLAPLEEGDTGSTPLAAGGNTGGGAAGGTGGEAGGGTGTGGDLAGPGTTIPATPLTPVDPADPVAPAPASLDLAFAPLQLAPRDPEDLTLTASNTGGTSAQEVVVDVTLPANVSVVSSTVVAGRGVVPVLKAAALPCGTAVPQGDGTSLVICSVGVLAPGEKKELVVTVQASRGGTYSFGGTVHGKGLAPVTKTYAPAPVQSYGAEVDLAAPVVGELLNPGASAVRLSARNTGDVDAHGLTFSVGNLPSGSSARALTPGWSCAPTGSSTTCAAGEGGPLPAPDASASAGPAVVLDVQLVADGKAVASTSSLTFTAAASSDGKSPQDAASAQLRVGSPWAGASDAIPAGGGAAPQCVGEGASTASVVLAGVTNTTAYDDLRVRLDAVGSASPVVALARGTRADLALEDGYRFPAGTATLTLTTTVAGAEYTRTVPAGEFKALDCYRVPDGDWLATATVSTENVGGTVRLTGSATNTSTTPMDVRMLAPDGLGDVEDSEKVTLAPGASGTFTIDTGRAAIDAGKVSFRQYRWVEDSDPGDGKGYENPVPLVVEFGRAAIAPTNPAPAVGQCVFDPKAHSSSAPVTLTFDNSASTLPVPFTVAGRDDLARTVAAGQTGTVRTSVGPAGATFTVLADGVQLASHAVAGVSCYVPDWTVKASATSAVVDRTVRLTGRLTNSSNESMQVSMVTPYGAAGAPVTVEPGTTATFTQDTGKSEVPAGTVELRQSRTVDGKAYTSTATAGYEAARYVPVVVAPVVGAPAVGACWFEDNEQRSYQPVTFVYDNTASTQAVTFHIEGSAAVVRDSTRTVQPGTSIQVKAPSAGESGATYRVVTDAGTSWTFQVAGKSCLPAWQYGQFYVKGDRVVSHGTNYVATVSHLSLFTPHTLLGSATWDAE
ncbi:sigma-70 family RNA polymerase sigma factor [Oerskovia enterophila]|uniref:ECF RNA polymerase sigma-E factor n=2 Tax=Oerskovia enterophila TaxID=43678 RepID=A0A163PTM0_9CELL|nr:sigma-70 family RNA polymerase sigma factor [Oerskovia enterophila]KZM33501.1 ECF RNA polymerase sigma-E factor [Oerskovia enterophila]